ncbi:Aldo/keto reductase [Cerioporus squamosus]|nr:Aldo/keto reductase [Cerioporus squamosus]
MSNIWKPADIPPTKLGYYRQLAPLAGVHVSPLALGAMSIGDNGRTRYDAFYDAGGNFIDTANNYQDESSEEFIGEWMEKRGIRDEMVIATKYTTNFKRGNESVRQQVHYTGNNMKAMHISVEASLKKLRTDYIDILYVHWWDWDTGVEEIMNGLHNLVVSGKVLYLGISDTAAWIVAKANQYARCQGKTPFVIYQGAWSILLRDFERDIIPMARAEGSSGAYRMALAPWNVLAGGKVRTDEEEERRHQTGEKGRQWTTTEWERTEDERRVCKALEEVAKQVGAESIQAVAIAYVMHKTTHVLPIVGGRKVEQLEANIEALDVTLSEQQITFLESSLPFNPGFPHSFCGDGSDYIRLQKTAANFVRWPRAQPIRQ